MGRGKRAYPGHRGGDAVDRHGARGSDDERWTVTDPEEDPLRDLRPHDDDLQNPAADDYIWPEMNDENAEDD
jgi:hypothetical protein